MPVFDLDAFASSLKTKYNIADEDLAGFDEAKKGFLRQDEFSRRSQKLDEDHGKRVAIEDKFHNDLKSVESQLLTRKQKLDLVDQLESKYGPAEEWSDTLAAQIGNRFPQLADDTGGRSSLTLETVQKLITDAVTGVRQEVSGLGNGAAIMIDFMADVPERFKDTYGKKFPKKEFGEFFAKYQRETGITNPFVAFDAFEKPFMQEHMTNKHKEELETARKEGAQSALSKHGIVESPVAPRSKNIWEQADAANRKSPVPVANANQPAAVVPPSPDAEPSHEEKRHRVGSSYQQAMDAANSGKIPGVLPGT